MTQLTLGDAVIGNHIQGDFSLNEALTFDFTLIPAVKPVVVATHFKKETQSVNFNKKEIEIEREFVDDLKWN